MNLRRKERQEAEGSPVNTRCVCSTCRISYEEKSRESQGVNNTAQIRAGAKQSSQGHGAIASWEDTTQGAMHQKWPKFMGNPSFTSGSPDPSGYGL